MACFHLVMCQKSSCSLALSRACAKLLQAKGATTTSCRAHLASWPASALLAFLPKRRRAGPEDNAQAVWNRLSPLATPNVRGQTAYGKFRTFGNERCAVIRA